MRITNLNGHAVYFQQTINLCKLLCDVRLNFFIKARKSPKSPLKPTELIHKIQDKYINNE